MDFEFDFEAYEGKFGDWKVLRTYLIVLEGYKTNGVEINHAIAKMFHRIFDDGHCNKRWLFYQLSVLRQFDIILSDRDSKAKEFDELRGFIKRAVVQNFFKDAEK